MSNPYYAPGSSASDYEAWAGTDFDGEPTCGEDLDDNGDCPECDFGDDEQENEL
jgi:hypothetical protein